MEITVKYLPFIIIILLTLIIIITLYLSIVNEDAAECLLYMNETKTVSNSNILPVGRCILGQAVNLLWVTASFLIYIKHRQVNDILNRFDMHSKKTLNRITLQVGLTAAFGCSIVANFQDANFYMYLVGFILMFGFSAVYQCLQTTQYWILGKIICQRNTTRIRIILSVVSVISFITFFICDIIAYMQKYSGSFHQKEDNGFTLYYVSISLQCVCAASVTIYLILFYQEFTKITLYEPDVFVEDKVILGGNMQQTNEAFEIEDK